MRTIFVFLLLFSAASSSLIASKKSTKASEYGSPGTVEIGGNFLFFHRGNKQSGEFGYSSEWNSFSNELNLDVDLFLIQFFHLGIQTGVNYDYSETDSISRGIVQNSDSHRIRFPLKGKVGYIFQLSESLYMDISGISGSFIQYEIFSSKYSNNIGNADYKGWKAFKDFAFGALVALKIPMNNILGAITAKFEHVFFQKRPSDFMNRFSIGGGLSYYF